MKKIIVLKFLWLGLFCFLMNSSFSQRSGNNLTEDPCACNHNLASPYSDNELVFRVEPALTGTDLRSSPG